MKVVLYTVVDKVAKLASNPMVHMNDEEAKRYFEEIILKQPIPAARPNDFEYKRIGAFNRETGEIING